eukprot:8497657-Pyramimonas_sp.AAC.1
MVWSGAVFRPSAAICVRSQIVHSSHDVAYWPEADILWCLVCGSYSSACGSFLTNSPGGSPGLAPRPWPGLPRA